jgi:hypothetical protein
LIWQLGPAQLYVFLIVYKRYANVAKLAVISFLSVFVGKKSHVSGRGKAWPCQYVVLQRTIVVIVIRKMDG